MCENIFSKNLNYVVFLIILILLITLKVITIIYKSVSYLSFDLYQKIFAEKKDTEVVIIDIDEKSLENLVNFHGIEKFAKILDNLIHQIQRQSVLIYFLLRKTNNHQRK